MPINHEHAHGLMQAIQGLLTQEQLANAVHQATVHQLSLLDYLISNNLLTAQKIAQAIAEHFNLHYANLAKYKNSQLPTQYIHKEQLEKYALLPLEKKHNTLIIAISNPHYLHLLEEIKFHTKLKIQIVIAAHDQLMLAINKAVNETFYHAFFKQKTMQENTVAALIDRILTDAIYRNASDIHFEPMQDVYRVRTRIDGILHETIQPTKQLALAIANRLKIMAALDIAERRLPQDGRFAFTMKTGMKRDCRISTCPTLCGEKSVIRILNPHKHLLNIDELGLSAASRQQFINAIHKPQGLVLVTGPTGSGKTISLYTALNLLNTIHKNIVTIEDPIEIQLDGINQVNVHPKAGLDFSTALRAFLRQDPDIIMVGEIRDYETAAMAIRAAHTGHLVLTTLHTNNTTEALTRLTNMGIASYNVASAVNLIIAQRLIRTLCPHCNAIGCLLCTDGYNGRTGVFEILSITSTIRTLIANNASAAQLAAHAQQEGMQTLWEAALDKVTAGVTSSAEIIRVIEK